MKGRSHSSVRWTRSPHLYEMSPIPSRVKIKSHPRAGAKRHLGAQRPAWS